MQLIRSHKIYLYCNIPDAWLLFFGVVSCQFLPPENVWQIVIQSVDVLDCN